MKLLFLAAENEIAELGSSMYFFTSSRNQSQHYIFDFAENVSDNLMKIDVMYLEF